MKDDSEGKKEGDNYQYEQNSFGAWMLLLFIALIFILLKVFEDKIF